LRKGKRVSRDLECFRLTEEGRKRKHGKKQSGGQRILDTKESHFSSAYGETKLRAKEEK